MIKMIDCYVVIKGTVNVGFQQRVSDFLYSIDRTFISVFDTVGLSGSVVIVNKAHVTTVESEKEADEFVERQEASGGIKGHIAACVRSKPAQSLSFHVDERVKHQVVDKSSSSMAN